MNGNDHLLAPGARVFVRDAEWLIRRVDRTSTGGLAINVVGLSELVRNKEAIFLTEIEKAIAVLDPADTKLVPDTSIAYRASRLYMESLLRQTPPTDPNLYMGHRAAMDLVPYQLEPTIQALQQPRSRILIADAVGLGKTLEAGILLSELIRRGRGKRILVIAVKSMLTQFQKELWSRFTIPLIRLDSVGIQRLRSRIPTNHNPFYYYDKTIISIDTLKQDAEYRTYLENAYWDIIVIDEAHNVAERGAGASLRARLAKLVARRSDTLIMLSATPHDGKARSFASLMNMLDPTAIANPEDYGPEDIKGLFIRRFKKDIQHQVTTAFQERRLSVARCQASPAEERAFATLADLQFSRLDRGKGAGELFKTTLEKALFSSPAACRDTIRNRIKRLQNLHDPAYAQDIRALEALGVQVEGITPAQFSKYQHLLQVIRSPRQGCRWTGKETSDRLVIFTERIETLRFLHQHLPPELGLKNAAVAILHGSMSDIEQQRVVEEFGKDEAAVRLLIASDVAAEGINLHYLSHRMIHFDIPWSLMVFQQRNGRIDRYGQEQTPQIVYLVTQSQNAKIRGDMRILELLIEKDDQAVKNIGDPSVLMGVYDIGAEEKITAEAIESGQSPEAFARVLDATSFDPLALLLGDTEHLVDAELQDRTRAMPSLFQDDFAYLEAAMQYLRQSEAIQATFDPHQQFVQLTAPEELKHRLRFLPKEMSPEDGLYMLSANPHVIQEEIRRSRKDENAWPRIHYLWALHPVLEWVNDKVTAAFGRREAPVLNLYDTLEPGEVVFVLSGLIPNRKAQPLLHRWFGVTFKQGDFLAIEDFTALLDRTELGQQDLPNRGQNVGTEALQALLPEAVAQAERWMRQHRQAFETEINVKLNDQLTALEQLRRKQHQHLERRFEDNRQPEHLTQGRKAQEQRDIDRIFDDYIAWVEDTMTTEDRPYIQVVALLKGVD
jgi:superfamily II DNA or RNA helicase